MPEIVLLAVMMNFSYVIPTAELYADDDKTTMNDRTTGKMLSSWHMTKPKQQQKRLKWN